MTKAGPTSTTTSTTNRPVSSPCRVPRRPPTPSLVGTFLPPPHQGGQRVSMGQVIGWMGNSGNAKFSVTHLHFEIHDPTCKAVNPYTSLRAAEFVDRCLPAFVRPTPIT